MIRTMKDVILVIVLTVAINISLAAQTYISANVAGSYWQHTDLFGAGAGLGLEYQMGRWAVTLDYQYGYGSYHRFKDFDNIDYDNWTTVLVDEGPWVTDLGANDEFNRSKPKTDYGKQHQLSLEVQREVWSKGEDGVRLGLGAYSALVEHFYTFTNIEAHYLEIVPIYRGPLNYIPVSHQRFISYGVSGRVQYDMQRGHRRWSPYIMVGVGPNYGSLASLGVKLSTAVKPR
jgi:hypothetical protein